MKNVPHTHVIAKMCNISPGLIDFNILYSLSFNILSNIISFPLLKGNGLHG